MTTKVSGLNVNRTRSLKTDVAETYGGRQEPDRRKGVPRKNNADHSSAG